MVFARAALRDTVPYHRGQRPSPEEQCPRWSSSRASHWDLDLPAHPSPALATKLASFLSRAPPGLIPAADRWRNTAWRSWAVPSSAPDSTAETDVLLDAFARIAHSTSLHPSSFQPSIPQPSSTRPAPTINFASPFDGSPTPTPTQLGTRRPTPQTAQPLSPHATSATVGSSPSPLSGSHKGLTTSEAIDVDKPWLSVAQQASPFSDTVEPRRQSVKPSKLRSGRMLSQSSLPSPLRETPQRRSVPNLSGPQIPSITPLTSLTTTEFAPSQRRTSMRRPSSVSSGSLLQQTGSSSYDDCEEDPETPDSGDESDENVINVPMYQAEKAKRLSVSSGVSSLAPSARLDHRTSPVSSHTNSRLPSSASLRRSSFVAHASSALTVSDAASRNELYDSENEAETDAYSPPQTSQPAPKAGHDPAGYNAARVKAWRAATWSNAGQGMRRRDSEGPIVNQDRFLPKRCGSFAPLSPLTPLRPLTAPPASQSDRKYRALSSAAGTRSSLV